MPLLGVQNTPTFGVQEPEPSLYITAHSMAQERRRNHRSLLKTLPDSRQTPHPRWYKKFNISQSLGPGPSMCAASPFLPHPRKASCCGLRTSAVLKDRHRCPGRQQCRCPVSCPGVWNHATPSLCPALPPSPWRFARSYHHLQLLKALKKANRTLHRPCVDGEPGQVNTRPTPCRPHFC